MNSLATLDLPALRGEAAAAQEFLGTNMPIAQGGPNPVSLNPVFQGSSCIHCAAGFPRALSLPGEGLQKCSCRSCSELLKQKNRI